MRRLESDKTAHAAAVRLTPTAILAKRPPGRPLWYSRSRIIEGNRELTQRQWRGKTGWRSRMWCSLWAMGPYVCRHTLQIRFAPRAVS
jgi:hypothetical protein